MSLDEVRIRVAEAAERFGRDPEEITIVAVTKSQPIDAIQAAYDLGLRDFGENRAQDLVAKADVLPSDIRWHFVGRLQTNKARIVRPRVVLLHSMDRAKLAEAWLKGPGLPPDSLLQVNIGREPQKGGVDPEDADELVHRLTELGIALKGLMAIPPVGPPSESRGYFRELAELRDQLVSRHPGLDGLSAGMTDDYEIAVEEGSTMVRIGRAIFGPRQSDA
ncbi:MAG: YggS family pyridoxal phosphate-dependent enzyme [Acidimicrobiia bacterium]